MRSSVEVVAEGLYCSDTLRISARADLQEGVSNVASSAGRLVAGLVPCLSFRKLEKDRLIVQRVEYS